MSEIFRYDIKSLTKAEKFESEHRMESFLYNNPHILGVFRYENGEIYSPAVIQQFPTERKKDKKGYIDLMALCQNSESDTILKIIELKKIAYKDDFIQLKEYLEGLHDSNPNKDKILEFIKNNSDIEDEEELNRIYNNTIGIFIGCDFEPELIINIKNWNDEHGTNIIDLYKLLLFKTQKSTYVVLDKIISVSEKPKGKKNIFSWEKLAKKIPEFTVGDLFYINEKYTKGDEIYVKTTRTDLEVTLIRESIKIMREKNYLGKSKAFGSDPENFSNKSNPSHLIKNIFPKISWNNREFEEILTEETNLEDAEKIPVSISNLLQLVFLANDFNYTGWSNPELYYIHEKTGKKYKDFKKMFKEK